MTVPSSGACEVCGQPVNIQPGGDGYLSANGVTHDRCRRGPKPETIARQRFERAASKAPLFAAAGLIARPDPALIAEERLAQREGARRRLAAEEAAEAELPAAIEEARAAVRVLLPADDFALVEAALPIGLPVQQRLFFWREKARAHVDGSLLAWLVEQREAAAWAAELRGRVAALVSADELADLDAFIAERGRVGIVAEIFWRARLAERSGISLAKMGDFARRTPTAPAEPAIAPCPAPPPRRSPQLALFVPGPEAATP